MHRYSGMPGGISSETQRRYLGWVGAAVFALAMLALQAIPASTFGALDLIGSARAVDGALGTPADNFPGSAFFYVEGAFDPAPGESSAETSHIYTLSSSPAAVAEPFRAKSALDQYRAVNCLTSAIYYEAGNEPEAGQRAVAQVVLNRLRHPAWPHSVCAVVYQGTERAGVKCQFTFSCDGAMARIPSSASWLRARKIAEQALAGSVFAPVGLATHYHTLAVHPGWAGSMVPVAVVGAHIFYRLPGLQGATSAFTWRYTGRELQSGPSLRATAPEAKIFAPLAPIIATSAEPVAPSKPDQAGWRDGLPQSTIRAEFQNSGKPLI